MRFVEVDALAREGLPSFKLFTANNGIPANGRSNRALSGLTRQMVKVWVQNERKSVFLEVEVRDKGIAQGEQGRENCVDPKITKGQELAGVRLKLKTIMVKT